MKHLSSKKLRLLKGGAEDWKKVYCKKLADPEDILLGYTYASTCEGREAIDACLALYSETSYSTC